MSPHQVFTRILHVIPLTLVESRKEVDDIKELISICKEYHIALRCGRGRGRGWGQAGVLQGWEMGQGGGGVVPLGRPWRGGWDWAGCREAVEGAAGTGLGAEAGHNRQGTICF